MVGKLNVMREAYGLKCGQLYCRSGRSNTETKGNGISHPNCQKYPARNFVVTDLESPVSLMTHFQLR